MDTTESTVGCSGIYEHRNNMHACKIKCECEIQNVVVHEDNSNRKQIHAILRPGEVHTDVRRLVIRHGDEHRRKEVDP